MKLVCGDPHGLIHPSAWKWRSRKCACRNLHTRTTTTSGSSAYEFIDMNVVLVGGKREFRLRWCTRWCSKGRDISRLLLPSLRLWCKQADFGAEEEGFEPSIPR